MVQDKEERLFISLHPYVILQDGTERKKERGKERERERERERCKSIIYLLPSDGFCGFVVYKVCLKYSGFPFDKYLETAST